MPDTTNSASCGATFGPFLLLAAERRLLRDGVPVQIGSRALDILIVLVNAAGTVVDKRNLLAQVWPGVVVEESSVRAHIAGLRKALGDDAHDSRYVANVPGRGYCFVAPIQRQSHEEPRTADAHPDAAAGGAPALPGTPATQAPPAGPALRPVAPRGPVSTAAYIACLPPPLERIIGRDAVIALLARLLDTNRFLSVVGPGGIGKTTVAIALAHGIADRFEGRIACVDLSGVGEAPLVLATVASALGVRADASALLPAILGTLRERPTLLLLDGCEHLIDTAALLCERVFLEASQTTLIATSREPLRAHGESVFRLPPLAMPPAHGAAGNYATGDYPAVQMFVERARAAGLESGIDLALVAHLCRQLDGLPLALELAAARASSFGVAGLAQLLEQRFGLHWQGRRTAHPRHQTLAAMLDWSYKLLPEYERQVLCGLAVFQGQFNLRDAVAVMLDQGDSEGDLIDAIDALVAKSLVACTTVAAEAQYRLLDTTRAYAASRLDDSADASQRRLRHAQWLCVELERSLDAGLLRFHSHAHSPRAARLGDLRAALTAAFAASGDHGLAVRLAAAASHWLMALSLLEECRLWASAGLACIVERGAGVHHEMTLQAALAVSMMFTSGEQLHVKNAIDRGLELAQRQADVPHQLWLLAGLHMLEVRYGDVAAVYAVARRAQEVAAGARDDKLQRLSAWMLGMSHHLAGRQDEALRYCNPLREVAAPDEPLWLFGFDQRIRALIVHTRALWLAGFPDQAEKAARLAIAQASASPVSDCLARLYVATVFMWLGDLAQAEASIEAVLAQAGRHGLSHYRHVASFMQGELWVRQGHAAAGVRRLTEHLAQLRGEPHEVLAWGATLALAEGHADCGSFDHAHAVIDQLLANAGSARFDLPELMRVKASLMLRANPDATDAAAALLWQAVGIAKEQAARSWVLRCATSLAELPPGRSGGSLAPELLAATLAAMPQGHASGDIARAAHLLSRLHGDAY
ncbi:MAG TPA: winged helix-turn-helix domain-containing protein [Duganella sp.]|nr:winged helix-turn-helix domain-containing protein [Duganella sp.]